MQEILKNEAEEKVYSTLDKLNIKYDRVDHKPVFTAEEAKSCVTGLIKGVRCKNLFLQDTKKNYYLYFITPAGFAQVDGMCYNNASFHYKI